MLGICARNFGGDLETRIFALVIFPLGDESAFSESWKDHINAFRISNHVKAGKDPSFTGIDNIPGATAIAAGHHPRGGAKKLEIRLLSAVAETREQGQSD
jgi:hypothetical protein